jgi:hypothetical protein
VAEVLIDQDMNMDMLEDFEQAIRDRKSFDISFRAMRERQNVIAEIIRWRSGFFQFEPLTITPGGEIEVDVKDFLLSDGFSPQEMLGDTAPEGLPVAVPPEPGDDELTVALDALVPEAGAPAFTAEITLRLMRYAAQMLSRGVLFVVRLDELRGMGQFGVQVAGQPASEQVRETVVPLGEPSVLRDVVEKRETYRGPLESSRWNRHLVHRLGGQEPGEVVVVPMIVVGAVRAVFYGDNLPENRPIGPIDTLEFMIAEAGLAMERTLMETKERALHDKRDQG